MARKYTNEFKLEMIKKYLKYEKSIYKFVEENNLPSATFYRWLKIYEKHGEQYFIEKKEKRTYSTKFKLEMVKKYLKSEISMNEFLIKNDIPPKTFWRWVEQYKINGEKSFTEEKLINHYTNEFKLEIIKEYLATDISTDKFAIQNNIPTKTFNRWIDY